MAYSADDRVRALVALRDCGTYSGVERATGISRETIRWGGPPRHGGLSCVKSKKGYVPPYVPPACVATADSRAAAAPSYLNPYTNISDVIAAWG